MARAKGLLQYFDPMNTEAILFTRKQTSKGGSWVFTTGPPLSLIEGDNESPTLTL